MHLTRPTYKIHFLIDAPKIHTDLLWDLSLLFVILIVVYFSGVFFFKNKISSSSKKVAQRKKELSPMISEFLFHDEDDSKNEKTDYVNLKIKIRHLLKDSFNRRVLSEVLLDLRKDVTGDTQRRLFGLYKNLGLHKDAYQRLKSWQWHIISKGILELTQMQVEESYNLITKFINDKRPTIRKQAEIAAVSLRHEGINYFLDTTRYKISEWQQLKLLDVLRNLQDFQPPRFKAWLTSTNRHVVLFALRLIKYYNQNDVSASLIELTKHKNNQIKDEAIRCIKEFNIVEALETLEIVFWKSTVDIKISILDTIATIGNKENVEFLKLIEKKEANFAVRSKAVSSINAILPESVLPTDGILDISNYQVPEDLELPKEIDENWELSSPETVETTREIGIKETDKRIEKRPKKTVEKKPAFEAVCQLPVFYEEITGAPETIDKEIPEEHYHFDLEVDDDLQDIDLKFLPIVVEEYPEPEAIEITDEQSQGRKEQSGQEVREVNVAFEEVMNPIMEEAEESEEHIPERHDELDLSQIGFLPIVVDEVSTSAQESDDYEPYRYSRDREVNKDELVADDIDLTFEEVGFAEETTIFVAKEMTREEELPKSASQFNEELIDQIEVQFEEVIPENKNLKTPITNEDEAIVDDEGSKDLDFETFLNNDLLDKGITPGEKKRDQQYLSGILKHIPEIELFDQETLEKMELLNDIEELGDEREIPLLLEYLDRENIPVVKERIEEILKKFSCLEIQHLSKTKDIQGKKGQMEHTSVLEDFFGHCDSEAKLILLDTLDDIIDQKDIDFLNVLLEDPDVRISEKARLVLNNWHDQQSANEQSKSDSENTNGEEGEINDNNSEESESTSDKFGFLLDQLEIRESDTYDIFDIDFEIDTNEGDEKKNDDRENNEQELVSEGPILDCFRSIQTLLIGKFNG